MNTVQVALQKPILDQLNSQQQAQLQRESPETVEKIKKNDEVAKPDQLATENPTPLTVEDIKALAGAGVKDEVIAAEIKKSKSTFSQQDINELQQAKVRETVLKYIRDNAAK